MYFRCSTVIHACPASPDVFSIRFFDLRADPVHPPLVAAYAPSRRPHEMYLWVDPANPARALLWLSTPTSSVLPDRANLVITDVSRARDGIFTEVARGNWNQFYPGAGTPANYDFDLSVHSMGVSADGTRTYLAYLRGHFLVLDTTAVATGALPPGGVLSLNDTLLTRWRTGRGGARPTAVAWTRVPSPTRR